MTELRDPPVEVTGDLVVALHQLTAGPVGEQLGVATVVSGQQWPVPPDVSAALVAVAREALTNANKHGSRAQVALSLGFEPDAVVLSVKSGVGAAHPGLSRTGSGLGIPGMKARMAEIGANLQAGPHQGGWLVSARWCR